MKVFAIHQRKCDAYYKIDGGEVEAVPAEPVEFEDLPFEVLGERCRSAKDGWETTGAQSVDDAART